MNSIGMYDFCVNFWSHLWIFVSGKPPAELTFRHFLSLLGILIICLKFFPRIIRPRLEWRRIALDVSLRLCCFLKRPQEGFRQQSVKHKQDYLSKLESACETKIGRSKSCSVFILCSVYHSSPATFQEGKN